MTLEINKGVPYPKGRWRKYPFGDMEVGDSFLAECEKERFKSIGCSILVGAKRYQPKKFRIHRETGGIRCWRVE